jgi:hypothetical protein
LQVTRVGPLHTNVIPAQAGIPFQVALPHTDLDSRLRGNDVDYFGGCRKRFDFDEARERCGCSEVPYFLSRNHFIAARALALTA